MKNTKKTLATMVTFVMVILGTCFTAFAAESSMPEKSQASKVEVSSAVERSEAQTSQPPTPTKISNPNTGQSGIALPLAVTLMAVAGAPLLLKKK